MELRSNVLKIYLRALYKCIILGPTSYLNEYVFLKKVIPLHTNIREPLNFKQNSNDFHLYLKMGARHSGLYLQSQDTGRLRWESYLRPGV